MRTVQWHHQKVLTPFSDSTASREELYTSSVRESYLPLSPTRARSFDCHLGGLHWLMLVLFSSLELWFCCRDDILL